MNTRIVGLIAGAAIAAGATLGVTLTLAMNRAAPAPTATPTPDAAAAYNYYQSMMGGYGGSMMGGGSYGWMMGATGYRWMTGGVQPPAWMTGGALPGFMMGSGGDPGQVMGHFWANAPGPRVRAADAARLASESPSGATVDAAADRVVFTGHDVHVTVVASPSNASDQFVIAGLHDPTIVIPQGASVTVVLINADSAAAHGIAVTAANAPVSIMPMMTATPAFSGAAMWFLGASTTAGMHEDTITFTADHAGTFTYLCPVPGDAQQGMTGALIVGSTP